MPAPRPPVLPLADLQERAASALRDHYGEQLRRDDLRVAAESFVGAREHFYTKDGEPDWLGGTHAYRLWVRETLTAAGVPLSERSRVLGAIRFHTGNVLRERLDPETVKALGLDPLSPSEKVVTFRQKSQEERESVNAVVGYFRAGPPITEPDEALAIARLIERALKRIDVAEVAQGAGDDAEEVATCYQSVASLSRRVASAARKAAS